jgi:hypothetical protein
MKTGVFAAATVAVLAAGCASSPSGAPRPTAPPPSAAAPSPYPADPGSLAACRSFDEGSAGLVGTVQVLRSGTPFPVPSTALELVTAADGAKADGLRSPAGSGIRADMIAFGDAVLAVDARVVSPPSAGSVDLGGTVDALKLAWETVASDCREGGGYTLVNVVW